MDPTRVPSFCLAKNTRHIMRPYPKEKTMKKFIDNLKRSAQENPVATLAVAALVITATAKFIDAAGHATGSRAYAKQVNHRINSK